MNDPLAIDLPKQTRELLDLLPTDSPYSSRISLATSPKELLSTLSQLLAVPSLTAPISALFRPLLIDLCARWLHDQDDLENRFVAVCTLIEIHQELFPVLSAFLQRPCFSQGPLNFVGESTSIVMLEATRLHRLLLAYYRLLRSNRLLPDDLLWPVWNLSTLFTTPHPDAAVKYLAIRCYSLHTGMAEVERTQLETRLLGEHGVVDCSFLYGENIDGSRIIIDGWLMPVMELDRIHQGRNSVAAGCDFHSPEGDKARLLTSSDLSPWTAYVHGVLMLKSRPSHSSPVDIVETPSATKALRQLAMLVSLRLPALITSPPSSGKSLFLSQLASLVHPEVNNQIVTVQLADTSLDPRALLGSYVSSPTQLGAFEWKDGVLIRAMKEGKWLVFKDIDRASMDVLGLIKPLTESLAPGTWIGSRASVDVPNRGRVRASEHFTIFATRSLVPSTNGNFPSPTFYGAHKFQELIIDAPSSNEIKAIIESRFPRLGRLLAQAIIQLWVGVQGTGTMASNRSVGLRELEKYCRRVEALVPLSHCSSKVEPNNQDLIPIATLFPNPSFREELFLEARDVFFGAGALTAPAQAHSNRIAALIANHIGIDSERCQWVLSMRVPTFKEERDGNGDITAIGIGRVRLLARPPKSISLIAPIRPFALHKPAVCLLSRIATAVTLCEPVLLTGETGTGKTSVITHLASLLRQPLVSLNLSHQTESSDLLGGFKPVDARIPASKLYAEFLNLFANTFSRKKNVKFEESIRKAVQEAKWKRVVILWRESVRLAKERIELKLNEMQDPTEVDGPRKRRKVDQTLLQQSAYAWDEFQRDVDEFDIQHAQGQGKFAFDFVEGPLVKALRFGNWILLDEINLASPETLECITGFLNGPTASVSLIEKGSLEAIPRHPDFRLFACMNPATDVGKRELPPSIRVRFTEIDVSPPDADRETLLNIIHQYISHCAVGDKAAIMNVADFYTSLQELAEGRRLADGSNHRPHYSMRTLARALTFAADISQVYGLRRALWEGCLMAFTMVLDEPSATIVINLAHKHIFAGVRNPGSLLTKEPSHPISRRVDEFVKFGPFYLEKGPLAADSVDDYIMTPSVEKKLIDLARIALTRRFPVLIEGPTSSGKTSAVEYLAHRTGHQFIRINNHEHTDIQEYIGSYVSDPVTGKLVFKDGLLVHALRRGHWIVLDELNLAPTDVLEALNRLLDDNRELVIPETHEVVCPHPHFMLFATQNPPGVYAGRKVLSRAFRNRFLEVHFQDVPQAELESILCQRCRIAPSYGQRIVAVFRELQKRRQTGRVFESKHGFATLRDLFRWAGRDAVGYQELAENGYMLLAERARHIEDKLVVKEVIESIMKVRIDEESLYKLHGPEAEAYIGCPVPSSPQIVWTRAMRRLFTLVARALKFNEPVLLVGETGSGKTSVCYSYAETVSKHLHSLSCHQNTETADLIGGLRPVRHRGASSLEACHDALSLLSRAGVSSPPTDVQEILEQISTLLKADLDPSLMTALRESKEKLASEALFEWHNGPLIRAMNSGDVFLLDEISLADDSVLERLNSVLEPERTIVLAERGGTDGDYPVVHAADSFKLLATMNPGGDYGKKELSPALRNRFTEIWVPQVDDPSDLQMIIESSWTHGTLKAFTVPLLHFTDWLRARIGDRSICTLRDLLAWVAFSNTVFTSEAEHGMSEGEIFHHAAHMTFLDGLGSLPQTATYSSQLIQQVKDEAVRKLHQLVPFSARDIIHLSYNPSIFVQFGPFALSKGPEDTINDRFNLQAPTAQENVLRVVRAYQVCKPILLEGSPGVGKTSLITALAKIAGYRLCRINLSDQTDLIDLFGSDLPVENGAPGEFAWRNAEFLQALQQGHWVLLDEMNLAPQAVLEGLNAVLDHRGTVYIPELGRSFTRHPSFRVFAAQNPLHQGGGRKGLPRSFLDRFTKVYVEELTPDDMLVVCREQFKEFDEHVLRGMIAFNTRLSHEVTEKRTFGREGSPWEFNLRDIIRWGELLRESNVSNYPRHFVRIIYSSRFRNTQDRARTQAVFDEVFSVSDAENIPSPYPLVSNSHIQFGYYYARRHNLTLPYRTSDVLQAHLTAIEAIGTCLSQSWLVVLTGPHSSGKTNLIRTLANLSGNFLDEVHISKATDTADLLGGFEQLNHLARITALAQESIQLTEMFARSACGVTSRFRCQAIVQRELVSDQGSSSSLLQVISDLLAELSTVDVGDPSLDAARLGLESTFRDLAQAKSSRGRFEWIDGPLVRAMKNGHWLLLDDANMCNPSVLDRLNSLCEPNGNLVLTERGFVKGEVQILTPHSNFRLLMTMDPQYGELSRAMRNRSVEISLSANFTEEDRRRILSHSRLPIASSISMPTSYILHEQARRGILPERLNDSTCLVLPSIAVDDDSILSTLLVHAPLVDISDVQMSRALVNFTIRSLSPSLYLVAKRYLKVSSPHGLLYSMLADPTFGEVSKVLALMVKSAPHNVSHLVHDMSPMDDFMVYPPCPCCTDRAEHRSHHTSKLELLNLFASLLLDKNDDARWNQLENLSSCGLTKCSSQLAEALQSVLVEIHATGQRLLDQFLSGSSGARSDYSTATYLLGISKKLRQILVQSSFDYSHVQVLSALMTKSLRNQSPVYQRLVHVSDVLDNALSLSSGLGLVDIWSQLRTVRSTDITSMHVRALACISNEVSEPALRREQLEVIALATLPVHLKPENNDRLLHITNKAKNWASKVSIEHKDINETCNPISILIELQAICNLYNNNKEVAIGMLQRLIGIALEEPNEDLRRFATYQQAIWNHDEDCSISPSIVTMAAMQWLEALWHKHTDPVDTSGPSIVFRPSHLLSSFAKSQVVGVSLLSSDHHLASVKRHLGLTVLQCFVDTSRLQQLTALFSECVILIASCFSSSFDDITLHQLRMSHLENSQKELKTLFDLLGRTNYPPLQKATQHLTSVLHNDADAPWSLEASVFQLGRYWVALSRLVLELFVPNVPIDPAALIHHARDHNQDQANLLIQQIELHTKLELRTAANETNDTIVYLDACAKDLLHTSHTSIHIPTRGDLANLHGYWLEVSQFLNQVVHYSKIDDLVRILESRDTSAFDREVVVQESIWGFCQRMETIYTEFDDVTCILRLAFAELRLGLHLMRRASEQSSQKDVTELVTALAAFPSSRSAHLLQALPSSSADLPVAELVILRIAAVAHCTQISSAPTTIRTSYEQAYRLWSIDRTHDQRREQELNSIYRANATVHDSSTLAEASEREFLELFPTFEDSLHLTKDLDENANKKTVHRLPPDRQRQLLALHLDLMRDGTDISKFVTGGFNLLQQTYLRSWVGTHQSALPDSLDKQSLHVQFSLLHRHIQEMRGESNFSPRPSNFYSDANMSEASKASSIIQSLRARLTSILRDWPNQMVLQHLIDRCDVILAFDCSAPIAKLLSALEQLLMQTEDWEMYANRENSLKEHRNALTTLIVEWRRLELSCWKGLFESQGQLFVGEAAEFWFRLYEVLIRGPLNAIEEDANGDAGGLQEYLGQLPSLLDEFIRTSSLGQFEVRLDLLHSYERFIQYVAPQEPLIQREALCQVGRIVHASWRYFELFAPHLSASLKNQRRALEKEVEVFIKLASWKDVNVQALKQSAQKTHRQLYKLIRKFRDVLRQPVVDKMNPMFAKDAEGQHQAERTIFPVSKSLPPVVAFGDVASPSLPSHLENLRQTFGRFQGFISNTICSFLETYAPEDVEQLSTDIIMTTKNLADHVIPPDLTKEKREKHKKNLLLRKRKAWSDLLKELKRGGLSYNVKPEVLNRLRDECWIRDQPLMPASSTIMSTERAENYFDRLRGCLPELRRSLSNHHSDLGTRDLSRGIALVESGYSFALESRLVLSEALSEYTTLRQNADRLQVLSDQSETIDIDGHDRIEPMYNALYHSVRALEELAEAMKIFSEIEQTITVVPDLIGRCRELAASGCAWRDRVSQVLQASQTILPSVLLKDEYDTLVDAARYLSELPERLEEMTTMCASLTYVLRPTREWICELGSFSFTRLDQRSPEGDAVGKVDCVIDALLVTIQSMLRRCSEPTPPSDGTTEQSKDNYIRLGVQTTSLFTGLLDLTTLTDKLNHAAAELSSLPHIVRQRALKRVVPFLSCFLSFSGELLESLARWTCALFKLDYVVCSVVHTVGTQGFCIPPETEEGETAGDEKGHATELGGTGLGEGSGNQNVSQEIEDESQVEGLQGEDDGETDVQREKGKDEEKTIEMSEDFGGDMEDVPEAEDDDENEEPEGEEEDGPDEQLGELDQSDPAAVDEKLWGDEKGDDDGNEKLQNDRSQEGQSNDSEVVAKEDKKGKQKNDKKNGEDAQGEAEQGEGDEEEEMDATDEIPPEEMEPPNASGAPMDQHIPDADTLDLPDDMCLDEDPDKQGDQEDDLEMEDISDREGGPDDQMAEDAGEERERENAPDDSMSVEPEDTEQQPPRAVENNTDGEDDPDKEKNENDAVAQPDLTAGDGEAGMSENEPQSSDSTPQGQQGSASTQVEIGTGTEEDNQESENKEQKSRENVENQSKPALNEAPVNQSSSLDPSSTSEGVHRGPAHTRQPPPALPSNPRRSLGDVLKEVEQRFDEIFGPDEQSQPLPVPQHSDAEQVEYAHQDDAPEGDDMQALGPAGEEQVAKLRELKLVDQEKNTTEDDAMDTDVFDALDDRQELKEAKDIAMEKLEAEKTAERPAPDIEGAVVRTERDGGVSDAHSHLPDPSAPKAEDEMELEPETTSAELVLNALANYASNPTPTSASHLWTLYTSMTASLSQALCESLRLTLAPTLATRLKGDFRSGKRLNMRRVVAWVASEYTKDRIWMRRVKPSGREYQVLLAVDDSASMRNGGGASGGAIHLTYQTVALVVQALGKLEVGEVGVARFGEGWELVRGFGSDATGAKDWGSSPTEGGRVLNAFTFSQSRTDVAAFLEGSLTVLETARENSGSTSGRELWQLEIIISDGICQDHEKLRRVLRKAREMRVLVVFIIIDALNNGPSVSNPSSTAPGGDQSSILTLSQVSYKPSPTTGLMELTMERYLDSFPFEYYVVLRDVEALPRVLADTLREFFERVNEE